MGVLRGQTVRAGVSWTTAPPEPSASTTTAKGYVDLVRLKEPWYDKAKCRLEAGVVDEREIAHRLNSPRSPRSPRHPQPPDPLPIPPPSSPRVLKDGWDSDDDNMQPPAPAASLVDAVPPPKRQQPKVEHLPPEQNQLEQAQHTHRPKSAPLRPWRNTPARPQTAMKPIKYPAPPEPPGKPAKVVVSKPTAPKYQRRVKMWCQKCLQQAKELFVVDEQQLCEACKKNAELVATLDKGKPVTDHRRTAPMVKPPPMAFAGKALWEAARFGRTQQAKTLTEQRQGLKGRKLALWESYVVDYRNVEEGVSVAGDMPLHVAVSYGHPKIVKLLLDAGAKVEAPDSYGWMPLHLAAFCGDDAATQEIVRLLLEAKAEVDVVTESGGVTPLIAACDRGHADTVKLLVAAGANLHARDGDGKSAKEYGMMRGEKMKAAMGVK